MSMRGTDVIQTVYGEVVSRCGVISVLVFRSFLYLGPTASIGDLACFGTFFFFFFSPDSKFKLVPVVSVSFRE